MKLHYEKRGTGPQTLLLGHGFPFDHTMWEAQLAGLSDEFTVVAPDFRGMGKSPASGASVTTMAVLADDLAELLDALGIAKCTYCGLSMGGYVGLEFRKRHADRLERFILCDSNVRCDSPEGAAKRLAAAAKIEAEGSCAFMVDGMKKNLMTDETLRDEANPNGVFAVYRRMVSENQPSGVASVARGMAQRHDFTSELAEIRIPVLVLTGELDVLSPPDAMAAMAAAIPDAEFAVISGAAHLAPMERAQDVNEKIRQFLKK